MWTALYTLPWPPWPATFQSILHNHPSVSVTLDDYIITQYHPLSFGTWTLSVVILFCLLMKLQLHTYHGPQEVGEGLVVGHHVLHGGAEAGPLPGLPRPGHRITHPLYLLSSAEMVPSLPSLSTLTASGHQPQLPSAGTRRLPLSTHTRAWPGRHTRGLTPPPATPLVILLWDFSFLALGRA